MRIVYLNKVELDSHLPAVNFTLFNAYALAQAGAECYLFAQKQRQDFSAEDLLKAFDLSALANFHLVIQTKRRRFGIRTNQWFYLQALRDIRALHRAQPIAAVISRDPGALPYLARLTRKTGIATFYQPHNFYVDLSVRPDVNPKNARKYHLLEKKFIPRISAVLCLQDSQAAWFRQYFPHRPILVAKPGLAQISTAGTDRFAQRTIGYLGSLQLKKGVETLLQAMLLLKDSDFRLILVGGRNADEVAPVQKRVDGLGLRDRVEITGWIPFAQVGKYLDTMSVGVIPLQDTFYNRYLTAPNKLFDYLSHGIPIIAADLPAIRDFLRDHVDVRLFPPEQPARLAAAIADLFDSRENYESLQRATSAAAEAYLWKTRAQAMLQMIGEYREPRRRA